jgi:hypothetical protein
MPMATGPAEDNTGVVETAEVLQFKSVGMISQGRSGSMLVTQYDMNDVLEHVIPKVVSRSGRYAAIGVGIGIPALLLLALLTHAAMTADNLGAGFLFFAVIGALAGGAVGRAATKGIEMQKMRETAGEERSARGAGHKDFTVVREEDWEGFLESVKK